MAAAYYTYFLVFAVVVFCTFTVFKHIAMHQQCMLNALHAPVFPLSLSGVASEVRAALLREHCQLKKINICSFVLNY